MAFATVPGGCKMHGAVGRAPPAFGVAAPRVGQRLPQRHLLIARSDRYGAAHVPAYQAFGMSLAVLLSAPVAAVEAQTLHNRTQEVVASHTLSAHELGTLAEAPNLLQRYEQLRSSSSGPSLRDQLFNKAKLGGSQAQKSVNEAASKATSALAGKPSSPLNAGGGTTQVAAVQDTLTKSLLGKPKNLVEQAKSKVSSAAPAKAVQDNLSKSLLGKPKNLVEQAKFKLPSVAPATGVQDAVSKTLLGKPKSLVEQAKAKVPAVAAKAASNANQAAVLPAVGLGGLVVIAAVGASGGKKQVGKPILPGKAPSGLRKVGTRPPKTPAVAAYRKPPPQRGLPSGERGKVAGLWPPANPLAGGGTKVIGTKLASGGTRLVGPRSGGTKITGAKRAAAQTASRVGGLASEAGEGLGGILGAAAVVGSAVAVAALVTSALNSNPSASKSASSGSKPQVAAVKSLLDPKKEAQAVEEFKLSEAAKASAAAVANTVGSAPAPKAAPPSSSPAPPTPSLKSLLPAAAKEEGNKGGSGSAQASVAQAVPAIAAAPAPPTKPATPPAPTRAEQTATSKLQKGRSEMAPEERRVAPSGTTTQSPLAGGGSGGSNNGALLGVAALVAAGAGAYAYSSSGKSAGEVTEQAKQAVSDAADKAGDAAKEASEATTEAVDKAAKNGSRKAQELKEDVKDKADSAASEASSKTSSSKKGKE